MVSCYTGGIPSTLEGQSEHLVLPFLTCIAPGEHCCSRVEELRAWLDGDIRARISTLPKATESLYGVEERIRDVLDSLKTHFRLSVCELNVCSVDLGSYTLACQSHSSDVASRIEDFLRDPFVCFHEPGFEWSCPGSPGHAFDASFGGMGLRLDHFGPCFRPSQFFVFHCAQVKSEPKSRSVMYSFFAVVILLRVGQWIGCMRLVEWANEFLDTFKWNVVAYLT
jgi:hypothetical protein